MGLSGTVPKEDKKEEKYMSEQVFAELVKKEQLKPDIYKFSVKAPNIVKEAKPGNFIEIRITEQTEPFLRRPISIYNLDKENGILEFIFQVKGKGTDILAKREVGKPIDIIGPIGYGTFKYDAYEKLAIIGGGIGVFPLYELARQASQKANITTYLGFRSKEFVVLEEEFSKVSNELVITTDDGSYGRNGFAINFLKEDCKTQKPDCILACGPLPMLKAVRDFAIENHIPAQVSLEERMGCGIGICLGCAVKKKKAEGYQHVCKDGPVFDVNDVEF